VAWRWRPIPLQPRFWTPRKHDSGVHFPLHSRFWTPRKHDNGVHFHSIPDSGRHANMTVASTFHSIPDSGRHANMAVASISAPFPILDATPTWQWRPFPLNPRFWTPHQHGGGVHFHSIPDSGRHTDITLASTSTPYQILDATSTWQWRPLSTPFPILDATPT
jgi:hypothetical protein